jgi:hypothetical protein
LVFRLKRSESFGRQQLEKKLLLVIVNRIEAVSEVFPSIGAASAIANAVNR